MKRSVWLVLVMLALGVLACGSQAARPAEGAPQQPASEVSDVFFVDVYDPARDPFADLEAAKAEAQRSGRNILLDIGGDWCSWCHILDDFIGDNQDIADALRQNYVVVKINVSEENENQAFMAQYPAVAGYPHFYILDSQGSLLQSQNTAELEQGSSYNHDVFLGFLHTWAPAEG